MSNRHQRNRHRAFCKSAMRKGLLNEAARMSTKEFLTQSGGMLFPLIAQSPGYNPDFYSKGFVIPTEMRADALFSPPSTEYVAMTRRTIPTRMDEVREMVTAEQIVIGWTCGRLGIALADVFGWRLVALIVYCAYKWAHAFRQKKGAQS